MVEASLRYIVPFAALMCMATLLSYPRSLRAEVDLIQCNDVAASVTRANRKAISLRHKIANAAKVGGETIVLSRNGIHLQTMSVSSAKQNLKKLEKLVEKISNGGSCT